MLSVSQVSSGSGRIVQVKNTPFHTKEIKGHHRQILKTSPNFFQQSGPAFR